MRARSTDETATESTVHLARPLDRFIETFRQSFLAFSVDLGGLFAGSLLVAFSGVISFVPWALIIYPAILSMRGVIGGLFCGRLSTALHLGTIKPSFTHNTKEFYSLFYATLTLTFQSSLMIGAVASMFTISFWKASPADAVSILTVMIATMNLSFLIASPITLAVSAFSFRHGLDPDIIAYPVMSTVTDILDTLCLVWTLKLLLSPEYFGIHILGLLNIGFLFLILFLLTKHRRESSFAKTIKEFFLTLAAVTIIVNVTGHVLGKISEIIRNGRPEIYMVYPAVIDTIGDVGSVVGSIATTRLALGMLSSSFKSIMKNTPEIAGGWLSSAVWFILFSLISSYSTRGGIVLGEWLGLLSVLLTLNILAAPIMAVISYGVAVLTYRKGLNPDNFVIPIESSLSDSITTISLFVALSLFGGVGKTS